ncbi:MAG: hypothetical protein IAB76_00700, partial [Bacteroidetes bacterium]|nr:hypothetical protein [Candidatus Cryptobacteroides avistercoris]
MHKISIVCAAVMLAFPSCIKDTYIPDRTGGEGDSIILDIASETLPLMKSEASGAEIAVDHLDVLIFEENGASRWHERISSLNGSRKGTVTLSAKREDFAANSGYWVYLVANSSHPAEDFNNIDLNGLRSMVEKTENIHLTGWQGSQTLTAPKNFLMDGVAYPAGDEAEPANPGTVVLNDGVAANDTELKVTLRRAAAKIVVKIAKGEQVEFTYKGNAGFYLSNMPWTTSVVSGVDAPAELDTPEIFTARGTQFYDWTAGEITVTTYAYAHDWADVSALENELRLVVNIPLEYIPETSAGDESAGVYEDSYYQIPVSRDKILERNTCYEVRVTVNTPGATNPSKPVTLDKIEYEVVDWTEKTINVGGEIEDAAYLSLNRYELELHNIADDETSLIFASSSPVSVTVDRVWYIDKFGQESDVQYENVVDSDNVPCITVAAESGLNGNLTIHSDLPTNNTIRYIELTVSNEDNIDRTVVIRQYPLVYITNIQGWYSYRDDFEGTTYENKGNNRYVAAIIEERLSWNGWYWDGWSYGTGSSGFFRSKVVTNTHGEWDSYPGRSDIAYYTWPRNNSSSPNTKTLYRSAREGGNARMYHVQITSSSSAYTIGRPRITDGVTDDGADNAELVSPSFIIA